MRSEVEWFPWFLQWCRRSYAYTHEDSMVHEDIKRVVEECEGLSQVQSLLDRSIETAFKDEIWTLGRLAQERWNKNILCARRTSSADTIQYNTLFSHSLITAH